MDIKIGDYNLMQVERLLDFGVYLADGKKGILLPNRWVPEGTKVGDEIRVFICFDSEDRLIATTLESKAKVGDIAFLKVRTVTEIGAFLDMGLMKDLFVPRAFQRIGMREGESYLVKVKIDERTSRLVGTEWFESDLQNIDLTLKELDEVTVLVYRKTEIGYSVIVNNEHLGLIHYNDIFKPISIGESYFGFVKKIHPESNKLDIMLGKHGYERVETETEKVMRMLVQKNGSLPYNDKTSPETIYSIFGMSKKTFKMALGNLYKQKKIVFTKEGIESTR